MIKKLSLFAVVIASMGLMTSCNDDDGDTPSPETKALSLSITNLPNVGPDYVYEGWIMVDGTPKTTGLFSADDNGVLSKTNFDIATADLEAATKFILTIEPAMDSDPAPSAVHILAGDFSSNSASISIGDAAAIGDDFTGSTGKYILATPTDNDMSNEKSGIWFLDNSSGSPAQGLNLPTLPAGWKYEGWVVVNGTPLSTGKFTDLLAADAQAPYSSMMNPGPPFPGEDLLENAPAGFSFPLDLSGGTAVISLEPDPDDSPAPFAIKPLVGMIPAMAADHTAYDVNQNLGNIPAGTVSR